MPIPVLVSAGTTGLTEPLCVPNHELQFQMCVLISISSIAHLPHFLPVYSYREADVSEVDLGESYQYGCMGCHSYYAEWKVRSRGRWNFGIPLKFEAPRFATGCMGADFKILLFYA